LGFEEPAKPALMDEVPLSMTIGWLSSNRDDPPAPVSEEGPPSTAEAELMMMMDDDLRSQKLYYMPKPAAPKK
jgi:hypothetical protein